MARYSCCTDRGGSFGFSLGGDLNRSSCPRQTCLPEGSSTYHVYGDRFGSEDGRTSGLKKTANSSLASRRDLAPLRPLIGRGIGAWTARSTHGAIRWTQRRHVGPNRPNDSGSWRSARLALLRAPRVLSARCARRVSYLLYHRRSKGQSQSPTGRPFRFLLGNRVRPW
jgi:hypothetical protein